MEQRGEGGGEGGKLQQLRRQWEGREGGASERARSEASETKDGGGHVERGREGDTVAQLNLGHLVEARGREEDVEGWMRLTGYTKGGEIGIPAGLAAP